MIQFQTRLPVLSRIITSRKGYVVPRADGRVICGSTLEFAGFDKQVTADGLCRILGMALELCPALGSAPVDSMWAGLRPWTEDHLPLLGPGPFPASCWPPATSATASSWRPSPPSSPPR